MESAADMDIQAMNDDPEKSLPSFNPFDTILPLLAKYGWWAFGVLVLWSWIYGKFAPKVSKWSEQQADARHKKDPDAYAARMEAIEAARLKQQEKLKQDAEVFKAKEELKQEKKRQEFIDKNEGKGGGNRLGAKSEYMPLCGAGSSSGYKAPKKSKCPGGGCGK